MPDIHRYVRLQGFFTNPDCRYVAQNSGQTRYSFTLSLNSCGTQFINDFAGQAGQAYLENVLVLQVDPFRATTKRREASLSSFRSRSCHLFFLPCIFLRFVPFRTNQVYKKSGTRYAEFVASGKETSIKP